MTRTDRLCLRLLRHFEHRGPQVLADALEGAGCADEGLPGRG